MANLRALVLAGGAGRRLWTVTGGVPKQFWRFDGTTSLLEQTLARLRPLVDPCRTTIVIGPGQERFLRFPHRDSAPTVLAQPQDRGTAIALLLGLTGVADESPDDVVLISPSDHGISDDNAFRAELLRVAAAIVRRRADIVLCAAPAGGPSSDYGWILLGQDQDAHRHPHLRRVAAFIEKPSACEARRLYECGAAWSTFVVVGRRGALRALFERALPETAQAFDAYRGMLNDRRADRLRDIYDLLESHDFSRDVLAPSADLTASVWPQAVGWTDLGTPERLAAWQAIGATDIRPDGSVSTRADLHGTALAGDLRRRIAHGK